jgi:hypothetical protein
MCKKLHNSRDRARWLPNELAKAAIGERRGRNNPDNCPEFQGRGRGRIENFPQIYGKFSVRRGLVQNVAQVLL